MKSSEALRKVRPVIERGGEYVCIHLRYFDAQGTDVYRRLQQLFFGISLDTWLFLTANLESFPSDEIMREYRLAWIDWMIEGYEAVGD